MRDFDVATIVRTRPDTPFAQLESRKVIAGLGFQRRSMIDARPPLCRSCRGYRDLCLYQCLRLGQLISRPPDDLGAPVDDTFAATAITSACPCSYLGVRPMSDLPGWPPRSHRKPA